MGLRQDLPFREPGWSLYHGKRTGRIACHLRELLKVGVDPGELYVAGLFHDIGKDQDHHAQVGAQCTKNLLSNLISPETLETICEAIHLHNKRKNSDSFNDFTKLLQDADIIDHVGFIDIWMAFYWSGHHNESIKEHLQYYKGEDREQFHEYMKTHLNFDVSRQMFEDRIEKSEQFFTDFHRIYFEGI